MALVYKDRVLETSTTTGTGTYTLAGAVTGYQAFTAIGDGQTCLYAAVEVDANGNPNGGWEVGLGTYTLAGTTLGRTTVRASSNAGAAVNWSAGTRLVFVVQDAAATTDFTLASSLIVPVSAGYAPTADGSFGYDATRDAWSAGGAGAINGTFPRVVAVSHPAESLTNSTTSDQDYTSVFTIPASYLIENRVLRVSLGFQIVTGVSSATINRYLKVGGTKVFTNLAANTTDSVTRSSALVFLIHGTAAAGASVNVETMLASYSDINSGTPTNLTAQPIALATNGTLTIAPGVVWSATGSTDTLTLRTYLVEELN